MGKEVLLSRVSWVFKTTTGQVARGMRVTKKGRIVAQMAIEEVLCRALGMLSTLPQSGFALPGVNQKRTAGRGRQKEATAMYDFWRHFSTSCDSFMTISVAFFDKTPCSMHHSYTPEILQGMPPPLLWDLRICLTCFWKRGLQQDSCIAEFFKDDTFRLNQMHVSSRSVASIPTKFWGLACSCHQKQLRLAYAGLRRMSMEEHATTVLDWQAPCLQLSLCDIHCHKRDSLIPIPSRASQAGNFPLAIQE